MEQGELEKELKLNLESYCKVAKSIELPYNWTVYKVSKVCLCPSSTPFSLPS